MQVPDFPTPALYNTATNNAQKNPDTFKIIFYEPICGIFILQYVFNYNCVSRKLEKIKCLYVTK